MSALLAHYARTRDPAAREALIAHHRKLVHYVAARYQGAREPMDDLIQAGTLGLIHAIDRFDPDREVKFSPYAIPTIRGEIKRHFRDRTWDVQVPRRLKELAATADAAAHLLATRLGRQPSTEELADHLGVSEDDVREAQAVGGPGFVVSLDTPLDGPDGGSATLIDAIGRPDSALGEFEAYADLWRVLEQLDDRSSQIIHQRFFEERSQAMIARDLGLSQMQVSRLERRALERMRALLAPPPPRQNWQTLQ